MNEAIICRLFTMIKEDYDALEICDSINVLNDDDSSNQIIEGFRNGKVYI